MIEVVARSGTDRVLRLGSIPELRDYCYVVAGIVGEMLTELFLLNDPRVSPARDYLRARSALFGEALQLVNILKDAEVDAREGRIYIPSAQQPEVMALAREDLRAAAEYTLALQRAWRRGWAGRLQRAAGAAGDRDPGGHRDAPPRQQALPRGGAGDPGRRDQADRSGSAPAAG